MIHEFNAEVLGVEARIGGETRIQIIERGDIRAFRAPSSALLVIIGSSDFKPGDLITISVRPQTKPAA